MNNAKQHFQFIKSDLLSKICLGLFSGLHKLHINYAWSWLIHLLWLCLSGSPSFAQLQRGWSWGRSWSRAEMESPCLRVMGKSRANGPQEGPCTRPQLAREGDGGWWSLGQAYSDNSVLLGMFLSQEIFFFFFFWSGTMQTAQRLYL